MNDRKEYTIVHYVEMVDGNPVHDVYTANIPTELLDKFAHALVMDSLARAGIKYDYTDMEKRFGVRMDYHKALSMALDAGKRLIEDSFAAERQKNFNNYQDYCLIHGLDPKQILIDFPASK